jgi:Ca2+:H+ antiporter
MEENRQKSNESIHTIKKPISAMDGFMTIIKSSYLNVMVIFVPFGIASHFVWSPTITFILNFLAIIPLAKLLGFATEDIALRTGEVSRK